MAKFELHFSHSLEYDKKIDLSIRLDVRPSKEDYQLMLDAVETLNKLKDKYLPVEKTELLADEGDE